MTCYRHGQVQLDPTTDQHLIYVSRTLDTATQIQINFPFRTRFARQAASASSIPKGHGRCRQLSLLVLDYCFNLQEYVLGGQELVSQK